MAVNTMRVRRSGTPRGTTKVRMAEKRALLTSATPRTKTTTCTAITGADLPFLLAMTAIGYGRRASDVRIAATLGRLYPLHYEQGKTIVRGAASPRRLQGATQ